MISRLHVITQDLDNFSHIHQVELACKGGADWVQLRVKNTSYEDWTTLARDAIKICRKFGTKLIINDSVQVALEVNADGVHLGKDDMPIHSARVLLGNDKIIGGTGTTMEDIIHIYESGANYAGIGPFKFTLTKKNLSPLLGFEKYQEFITKMNFQKIELPIIAVGGILTKDVQPLLGMGIHGVAVSSAIFSSAQPQQSLSEFQKSVQVQLENPNYVINNS
ncbi:MAG TPA: thiamine phosphate synthase [Chitinophagales bacterium]|nr:thiamine phosphate synthase [Chitinophagales bacterium]